jgi:hypothetical protein
VARVEPVRFESLYIRTQTSLTTLLKILKAKPPGFAARTVKAILFKNIIRIDRDLLSMCTGLTYLSMAAIPEGGFHPLRLRRLCVCYPPDYAVLPKTLTHLEIFSQLSGGRHHPFSLLPNLTHLALAEEVDEWNAGSTEVITDMVDHILKTCTQLQMLVLLFDRRSMQAAVEGLQHIASSRFFVGCFQSYDQDWEDLLSGDDNWMKASRLSIPL